jgi:hypothetical protein
MAGSEKAGKNGQGAGKKVKNPAFAGIGDLLFCD